MRLTRIGMMKNNGMQDGKGPSVVPSHSPKQSTGLSTHCATAYPHLRLGEQETAGSTSHALGKSGHWLCKRGTWRWHSKAKGTLLPNGARTGWTGPNVKKGLALGGQGGHGGKPQMKEGCAALQIGAGSWSRWSQRLPPLPTRCLPL